MPTVHFGTKDEPATTLDESNDLIVVRTRSRRSAAVPQGPVATPQAAALQDGGLVVAFPEAGVEVYRVPPTGASLNDRKLLLRQAPDVRFAGGVLVDQISREPVLYTENLFVKFADDATENHCVAVIQEAGLTIKEKVRYAKNAYFACAPEGSGQVIFDLAEKLLSRDDVVFCHPELIRKRVAKAIDTRQWHLAKTTSGGQVIEAHANVASAHELTTGKGIIIAIIDDGVDIDHVEFGSESKIVAPRDASLEIGDPRPKDLFGTGENGDNHGTACAGVACANGSGGASGVAPDSQLMPIRLASALGSRNEANAFQWAAEQGADVISCSWGPADGEWWNPNDPLHLQVVPLPAMTRLAIDNVVANGRGGRGCVVLFAAGNGNESVQTDGYASYGKVIAVAACNDQGKRSVYSDFGDAVWCAFPSNDMGHAPFGHPSPLTAGIWTTDRTGENGYNPGRDLNGDPAGNYTNSFGGTSSACPGVAGVVALMLSVNAELTALEVRKILSESCDRIDPVEGDYNAMGHSPLYGYGRINARTAVESAANRSDHRLQSV